MSDIKSKRILVVDDEPDMTELVGYCLRAKGFEVETLNDANLSITRARAFMPNLVILDVMMPDLNGMQVCRLLRADPQFKRLPVIFLTCKSEEADRIQGFETGADDYICKPFSNKELVLRVQTILRRTAEGRANEQNTLQAGQIVLDIERHEVTVQGEWLELTATEFKLLRLLMERRGRVQTREHLLINVWNYETEIETRTVDTHVRRLREKLGVEANRIETIRVVGYRLTEGKTEVAAV